MTALGCPRCGRAVKADAARCQGCGQPMGGTPADPFAAGGSSPIIYSTPPTPYDPQPVPYANQAGPYASQPVPYANQPVPYAGPYSYPTAQHTYAGPAFAPRETSGMAIGSLVASLVWLCGVGSLIAVILGVIALGETRDNRRGGRGMAIAGLIIGGLGLLLPIGVVVLGMIGAATEPSQGY